MQKFIWFVHIIIRRYRSVKSRISIAKTDKNRIKLNIMSWIIIIIINRSNFTRNKKKLFYRLLVQRGNVIYLFIFDGGVELSYYFRGLILYKPPSPHLTIHLCLIILHSLTETIAGYIIKRENSFK